jgi:prolyl 4-hydroxylase
MVQNLFCQIYGRKRIRLIPSWNAPWLYNEYHVYSDIDLLNPDLEQHPLFANATVYDFILEPGEVLYIPVAWWHHLESLDVSISLTRKNIAIPDTKYGEGYIRESSKFKPYDPRKKSREEEAVAVSSIASSPLLYSAKTQAPEIKTLSQTPRIYLYPQFLSDEECDAIIALSSANMVSSRVLTDSGLQTSAGRTSSGYFLKEYRDHETVSRVEKRIAEWTGIPIENGEAMHVLNYAIGQEYKAHHDYFQFDKPGREKAQNRGGQRIATVLMYLADVIEGGETAFPKVNINVEPKKGDAILFYNVTPEGQLDKNTLHGSLPVVEGEKWTCTKWLREKALR